MTEKSILIRGGMVVEPSVSPEPFRADILTENGAILRLGQEILPASLEGECEVLDAAGCFVLPGGVDPHTHFELIAGGLHVADDFLSASRAALCGGTTSVVEHPGFGPEGCGLFHQMDTYRNLIKNRSFVDYGLHLVFQPPAASAHRISGGDGPEWPALAEMSEAVERGYASGKAYTTYDGMLDDRLLLRLMKAMGEAGCLLTVHCESDAITAWLRANGGLDTSNPKAHPASRPSPCEEEAVTRILALAGAVGVPVYIVHMSTAGAVEAVRRARSRGQTVYAETCPQYLLLTEECYARPNGLAWVMAPPLRREEDCRALWDALIAGEIDVVATDHCSYNLEQKRARGQNSVFSCPGGIPGVETRLPLLFTHGVLTGRLSWRRFVEVTAENPARIFGLARKGRLAPGMDADILVLDPEQNKPLTPKTLCHPADYCPFEGLPNPGGRHTVMNAAATSLSEKRGATEIPSAPGASGTSGTAWGWPRHVLLRGRIVLRDTALVTNTPHGEFLRRTP